jgi:hypothetical protein
MRETAKGRIAEWISVLRLTRFARPLMGAEHDHMQSRTSLVRCKRSALVQQSGATVMVACVDIGIARRLNKDWQGHLMQQMSANVR